MAGLGQELIDLGQECHRSDVTFDQSNSMLVNLSIPQNGLFVNHNAVSLKTQTSATVQQSHVLLQPGDFITIERDEELHAGITLPNGIVTVQTVDSLLKQNEPESFAISETNDTIMNTVISEASPAEIQYNRNCTENVNSTDVTFTQDSDHYSYVDVNSLEANISTVNVLNIDSNLSPKYTQFMSVKTVNSAFISEPWKCSYRPCSSLFATEENLTRHILLKHIHKTFKCQYCCKLFSSEIDYEIHVEAHNDGAFRSELIKFIPESEIDSCHIIPTPVTFIKVFHCSTCSTKFETSQDLAQHLPFHQKLFKCSMCNKQYGSYKALSIHQHTHSTVNPHYCEKCGKQFHILAHLMEHNKKHFDEIPFKCSYCDKTYQNQSPLRVHVFYNHFDYINDCFYYKCPSSGKQFYLTWRDAQKFKCQLCFKSFAKKSDMQSHTLIRCHRVNQFPCSTCPRKFSSSALRDEHESSKLCTVIANNNINVISNETGNNYNNLKYNASSGDLFCQETVDIQSNVMPYKCIACGKCFVSQNILDIHAAKHYGNVHYSCNSCDNKFANSTEVCEHKRIHTHKTSFICPHCENQLANKTALKEHVFYTHFDGINDCLYYKCATTSRESYITQGDALKNICETCGKVYLRRSELDKHKRGLHSDNPKPYKCDKCQSRFSTAGQLKVHSQTHSLVREFSCTICNVGCTTRSSLASHMIVHTDSRPYQCTYCGKTFARSIQVKRHTLTHTGERSHQCGSCGKMFATATDVKKHAVTHDASRVRPYNCRYCDKTYFKKSNLNTHILTHYRDF